MRSCISHFSWPDAGLCKVPSKPTLARAKGVGRYMCVFLYKCVCVCTLRANKIYLSIYLSVGMSIHLSYILCFFVLFF